MSTNVTFDVDDERKEVLVSIFGDNSGEDPEKFEVVIDVLEANTVAHKPDIATVTIYDIKATSRSSIYTLLPRREHLYSTMYKP